MSHLHFVSLTATCTRVSLHVHSVNVIWYFIISLANLGAIERFQIEVFICVFHFGVIWRWSIISFQYAPIAILCRHKQSTTLLSRKLNVNMCVEIFRNLIFGNSRNLIDCLRVCIQMCTLRSYKLFI